MMWNSNEMSAMNRMKSTSKLASAIQKVAKKSRAEFAIQASLTVCTACNEVLRASDAFAIPDTAQTLCEKCWVRANDAAMVKHRLAL